jgi:hypothetical protein
MLMHCESARKQSRQKWVIGVIENRELTYRQLLCQELLASYAQNESLI